jgi:hypothetical protein
MGEPVPSREEIMALAHDILEFAVKRRGEGEMHEPPEGQPFTEGTYSWLRQGYAWVVDAFAHALSLAPDPGSLEPTLILHGDDLGTPPGGEHR